jgi:hypothetical protein
MLGLRLFIIVLCMLSFYGCSTPSPYAANGVTGGYQEAKIEDNKYQVSFQGNGFTSRDMVWNYWMHRCAELTKEKGFTAFAIMLPPKTGSVSPPLAYEGAPTVAMFNPVEAPEKTLTKSAGAPIYIYTPGTTTTVTRYRAGGLISMFSSPFPSEEKLLLSASSILESLGPYVKSQGKETPPTREQILEKAFLGALRSL